VISLSYLTNILGELIDFPIYDELAQGTTHAESRKSASSILRGFRHIGGSVVLVTHSHELVELLDKKKVAIPLQVEFDEDRPTFKMIDGISRTSHADRVARRVGMDPAGIVASLRDRGYLGGARRPRADYPEFNREQ